MNTIRRRQTVIAALAVSRLLTVAATKGRSADFPPEVQQAFDAMETTPSNQWAYIVTSATDDQERIERFDPSMPETPWTLLQVNGHEPEKSDFKDYGEELENRELPNLPDDFVFSDLVDHNSLTLFSEDDHRARYMFNLKINDEEDAEVAPFLLGELTINKQPAYISAVELMNKEAFSPELGTNILKMHIQIAFEPLGDNGPFFLTSVNEEVEARVFGVMKIAETETISIGDYVYVGQ